MTPREAFRVGFLLRCVEDGLTEEATLAKAAAVKTALIGEALDLGSKAMGAIGQAASVPLDLASKGIGLAGQVAPWAVGGAVLAGAPLGIMAANMQDNPINADEVRKKELIATYRTFADQVRARDALRRHRSSRELRVPLS